MKLREIIIGSILGLAIGIPLTAYANTHKAPRIPEEYKEEYGVKTYPIYIQYIEVEPQVEEPQVEQPVEIYTGISDILNDDIEQFILNNESTISPFIIMAICEHESQGKIKCVGDNGNSLGLMQIQPRWHKDLMYELQIENLFDYKQNIILGSKILEQLQERGKGIEWSLMAYNGGENYANNQKSLTDYVITVISRANQLENLYNERGLY